MEEHVTTNFLGETTVHGLNYFRTKNRTTKCSWALIVTISLGLCVWQSVINVKDYLAMNVKTTGTVYCIYLTYLRFITVGSGHNILLF